MPITGILLIYLQLYTRQNNNKSIVHVEKKINIYKVKVKLKVLYHYSFIYETKKTPIFLCIYEQILSILLNFIDPRLFFRIKLEQR